MMEKREARRGDERSAKLIKEAKKVIEKLKTKVVVLQLCDPSSFYTCMATRGTQVVDRG